MCVMQKTLLLAQNSRSLRFARTTAKRILQPFNFLIKKLITASADNGLQVSRRGAIFAGLPILNCLADTFYNAKGAFCKMRALETIL